MELLPRAVNISGAVSGGAGTYAFPTGWTLLNADGLTPAANVAYVNDAWERRVCECLCVCVVIHFHTQQTIRHSTIVYACVVMPNSVGDDSTKRET